MFSFVTLVFSCVLLFAFVITIPLYLPMWAVFPAAILGAWAFMEVNWPIREEK